MTKDKVKESIQKDDDFLYKALLLLYNQQTGDEKYGGVSYKKNNLGFNSYDAPLLTGLAEWLKSKEFLTPKQKSLARSKITKYAGQISELMEET